MRPCFHVEIETPKKVLLNGLWLGPKNATRVYVWVHGLGSTMFSKLSIMDHLIDDDTAVLTFNNRGHDKIAVVPTTGTKRIKGGSVHEVFTDCVDDIEGAIRAAKQQGAREVILVGHSTGCQKSAYWGSVKGRGVKGIVLLAPISDYSSELQASGPKKLAAAKRAAERLIREGKRDAVLPESIWGWPWIADAQRFMTLYTGAGAEEVFTYWNPSRKPQTLSKIRLPILSVLAEHDEFADRPAQEIADWFIQHIYEGEALVARGAGHSFKGSEKKIAREITNWSDRI